MTATWAGWPPARPAGGAVAHLDRARRLEERDGALPGSPGHLAARAAAYGARPARATGSGRRRPRRARSIAERSSLAGTAGSGRHRPTNGGWGATAADWLLEAGDERARLRDARGLHYLRALLAAPGREIAALDLVAGGAVACASRQAIRYSTTPAAGVPGAFGGS